MHAFSPLALLPPCHQHQPRKRAVTVSCRSLRPTKPQTVLIFWTSLNLLVCHAYHWIQRWLIYLSTDLVRYGFIPEFISRLPSITTLSPLTPQDLRRVLTEVKGSLISQYTALFGYSGVEIRFSGGALDEICRKAAERGGGARGLRGIMASRTIREIYIRLITYILFPGNALAGTDVRSAVSCLNDYRSIIH